MELHELDLNLLLVLDALFQERTLTRAAGRLRLSQPTLSASLAKLRVALGDELFIRTNGVMQPTARALALQPVVGSVLRTIRLDILSPSAFDPARESATFNLTMSDIGELEFLPKLVAHLQREAPQTKIKTRVVPPEELVPAMDSGEVNLAVGVFPDLVSSTLKQQLLFRATSACLVRRGHPLIGKEMTVANYEAAEHVAVAQQGRTRDVVEVALATEGIHRRAVLQVSHFLSVPFLVTQSDLVATVPRPLAQHFAKVYDLVIVDVPFPTPEIEVKQFWHRRFDAHPGLKWLRGVLASLSQNQPSLGYEPTSAA